jgi:hypothetical protein
MTDSWLDGLSRFLAVRERQLVSKRVRTLRRELAIRNRSLELATKSLLAQLESARAEMQRRRTLAQADLTAFKSLSD